MRDSDFSIGQLHKFKMSHEITCQVVTGQSKEVFAKSVANWNKSLPSKIHEY